MSRVRGARRVLRPIGWPGTKRETPDTARQIATRLMPKGQFYVTGGRECAQFLLDDVIEAFGLTPDEAILLVAQGMLL